MAVHVQVEQALLLEVLAALLAGVKHAGVVIEDFVAHEIFTKVKGTFALVALETRQQLAVFVNVFLVGITDIASGEQASAVATLKHQLLIVLGHDVTKKKLLVLKNLRTENFLVISEDSKMISTYSPASLTLVVLEVLTQMIAKRLHALVGFIASPTLNNEVFSVMTHVKAKIVLAAENSSAVITS